MKSQALKMTAALLIAGCCLAGCYNHKEYIPPQDLRHSDSGAMDVLTNDGTIYRLESSSIFSSNVTKEIIGYGERYNTTGYVSRFNGVIPISEISLVKTSRPDYFRSILANGVIGVLLASTLVATDDDGSTFSVYIYYPSTGGYWGSCPFVFSHDGREYRFESETFAGAVCRGLERTSIEPLRYLQPRDGVYRLALANQSPESQHVNRIGLLAIDHPEGTHVIPDARGELHTVRAPEPPMAAVDFGGRNILEQITNLDDSTWESDLDRIDSSGDLPLRDGIVCEFAMPDTGGKAKLVIGGRNTFLGLFALERLFSLYGQNKMAWYHTLNTSADERKKLAGWMMREGGLSISVWVDSGWVRQSWLPDVGPRITAEKTVILDLARVTGPLVRIRLESATDLWRIDRVAIDYSPDEPIQVRPAELRHAVTERGDSVAGHLTEIDSLYYSTIPDQYALLTFGEIPRTPGKSRTLVLTSTGYYYSWLPEGPDDNRELVARILAEPRYGSRLYLPQWKEAKRQYALDDVGQPRFPVH